MEHTLSDYQGKTVFLNFWATWCPPCNAEMPDVGPLSGLGGERQGGDRPGGGQSQDRRFPYNQDVTREEVETFLSDGGFTIRW